MDVKKVLKDYKKKIDERLDYFLSKRVKRSEGISSESRKFMELIREYNLRGGKRIRPILVLFGYKACYGKATKAIVDAAIAVELMEAFLLVHDDIIDNDDMRRGYLSMHKVFEALAKRKFKKSISKKSFTAQEYRQYGISAAILAGDVLSSLGSEAISKSAFPAERKLKAIEIFNKTIINTCFGQLLDLDSEYKSSVKEADIELIHRLKTAIYTIQGPLLIGATLAGGTKEQLMSLKRFSIPLGEAFQIQDDILGMFGKKEKIGKPIGSDIIEGKKTLLVLKALEKGTAEEKRLIVKSLGNSKITKEEINRFREIVKKTGSYSYSRELAEQKIKKAVRIIKASDLSEGSKRFFISLADYLINREF